MKGQLVNRTSMLEEQKSKLFAVVNSLSRGIIVINKRNEIVLYNKGITNVLNILEGDINYSSIQKLLFPIADLNEIIIKTFETKTKIQIQPTVLGTRFFTIDFIPILHKNSVEEVILFISDVTEEINLQRSRDEFFSIASHELRTPLTAIRGNAEMILDNYSNILPNTDIKEMLFDIRDGSLRLTEIVNDFLDVSRLEMKKIEFKNETLEISEIIHETVSEMEKISPEANTIIYFDNELQSALFVTGDPDRIKQVLINLIGNALKFTPKGSIHITTEVLEKENMVEVSVSDTGNGIAPEQQNLLFHKFQQAGSSLYTRDTTRGTGLGLYICKLLIEGMNGKIWLKKSGVGEGSIFCFSLHLAKTPQT